MSGLRPTDLTVPCLVCGKTLEGYQENGNQPSNGLSFHAAGQYGSTAFDPMDGSQIEINVCDCCLTAKGRAGLVLVYPPRPPQPWSTPHKWNPDDSESESWPMEELKPPSPPPPAGEV
jgi:hypothetical protein